MVENSLLDQIETEEGAVAGSLSQGCSISSLNALVGLICSGTWK